MPNPILVGPEAYLRAINAPPILGQYSATMSVPYQSGGIGVGPGGRLEVKDAAGVADAARAWAAAMAQQPANPYAGMVFGDSPGQASQMAIGLRNQRAAEAAAAAARAQAAQQFAVQQEAQRQANVLNAQIRMAQLQGEADWRKEATAQRDQAARQNFVADILGKMGGSGSGSGTPGIDVTTLLQNKEKLRTTGAGLEAQQQAISNQMFLAAQQAASQFPGYTVSPGQGTNPYPTVRYVGDPNTQSVEAARAIQAAMLGQSAKPTGQWTDDDWSQWLNTGVEPTAGAPTFLNQLQNLQAQQAAAKANLASLSDVFAARKDLAGPKQGPNPQVLQALLQYLNPAPTQVPSRLVPPPYALLDNRTAPVVNRPRPELTPQQAAWYARNAPFSPNAPGQGPLTGLMPTPVPGPVLPGGINLLADAALGLFPGGVAPTPIPGPLSAPAAVQIPTPVPGPVTHELKNGRVVPVSSVPAASAVEPELGQYALGLTNGSIQNLLEQKDAAQVQGLRAALDADLASWVGTTPAHAAEYRDNLLTHTLQNPAAQKAFRNAYAKLDKIAAPRDFKSLDRALADTYSVGVKKVSSSRDFYLKKFREDMGPDELLDLLRKHVPAPSAP